MLAQIEKKLNNGPKKTTQNVFFQKHIIHLIHFCERAIYTCTYIDNNVLQGYLYRPLYGNSHLLT